jgi:Gram positive anchor.
MRRVLPITATVGMVAAVLAFATPAQALSCAPASVWGNAIDEVTDASELRRFSVDPATGALTPEASVPVPRVYGDIAIATEDGDVWGTDFGPAVPGDTGFYPVDPATGAEGPRVATVPPLTATVGSADELNALSFRADGLVYTAAGWSTNIFVVDLADGSWSRPSVEDIPQLEPTWDDNYPAGDFVTLESGEVLAVANAVQDAADYLNTTISYLVVLDFAAGTSKIVGRFSQWVNGVAQSGQWLFFAGQSGELYRLALADLPTLHDPAADLTAALTPVFDLPGFKWFGIASPQDTGVCPPVTGGGSAGAPTLPDTGETEDLLLLALGGVALLGAGTSAVLLARERRSRAGAMRRPTR